MRRTVSRLCLLVLLAIPFAGQTNQWKRYKNTDGNFSVLFPGEPEDSVNQTQGDAKSHTFLAKENAAVYTVVYASISSPQPVDENTFSAFKTTVFKEHPKCEPSTERSAEPAITGYIGHWYRMSCELPNGKVTILGNLYLGKHYDFAVMAAFPDSASEPTAGVNKFIESFSVIDPAK
jgi:hypothetical protein